MSVAVRSFPLLQVHSAEVMSSALLPSPFHWLSCAFLLLAANEGRASAPAVDLVAAGTAGREAIAFLKLPSTPVVSQDDFVKVNKFGGTGTASLFSQYVTVAQTEVIAKEGIPADSPLFLDELNSDLALNHPGLPPIVVAAGIPASLAAGSGVRPTAAGLLGAGSTDEAVAGRSPAPAGATGEAGAAAPVGAQGAGSKANSATTANQPTPLAGASLNFSDSLKLITTRLFAGKVNAWKGQGNLTLTSSLPASTPNPTTNTTYSNTEMLLPDGGVLNLYWNPSASLFEPDYLKDLSIKTFGDRGTASDRRYIDANKKEADGTPEISEPLLLFYWRDGIGVKALNREVNHAATSATGSTASGTASSSVSGSSNISDFGAAGSAYAAFGCDGGLLPFGSDSSSASGQIRIEGLMTATFADKVSTASMYPNTKNPKTYGFGWGGRLVFIITNNVSIDVQYMAPFGADSRYLGKVLLGGVSVSR